MDKGRRNVDTAETSPEEGSQPSKGLPSSRVRPIPSPARKLNHSNPEIRSAKATARNGITGERGAGAVQERHHGSHVRRGRGPAAAPPRRRRPPGRRAAAGRRAAPPAAAVRPAPRRGHRGVRRRPVQPRLPRGQGVRLHAPRRGGRAARGQGQPAARRRRRADHVRHAPRHGRRRRVPRRGAHVAPQRPRPRRAGAAAGRRRRGWRGVQAQLRRAAQGPGARRVPAVRDGPRGGHGAGAEAGQAVQQRVGQVAAREAPQRVHVRDAGHGRRAAAGGGGRPGQVPGPEGVLRAHGAGVEERLPHPRPARDGQVQPRRRDLQPPPLRRVRPRPRRRPVQHRAEEAADPDEEQVHTARRGCRLRVGGRAAEGSCRRLRWEQPSFQAEQGHPVRAAQHGGRALVEQRPRAHPHLHHQPHGPARRCAAPAGPDGHAHPHGLLRLRRLQGARGHLPRRRRRPPHVPGGRGAAARGGRRAGGGRGEAAGHGRRRRRARGGREAAEGPEGGGREGRRRVRQAEAARGAEAPPPAAAAGAGAWPGREAAGVRRGDRAGRRLAAAGARRVGAARARWRSCARDRTELAVGPPGLR